MPYSAVGFLWSLKSGHYDDLEGAAWRAIADDEPARENALGLSSRIRARYRQARGQQRGHRQRRPHADDAGDPTEAVEQLTEHRAADQAAQEIAGQICSARHAAAFTGGLPDKAGCRGLRKERTGTDQNPCGQHFR